MSIVQRNGVKGKQVLAHEDNQIKSDDWVIGGHVSHAQLGFFVLWRDQSLLIKEVYNSSVNSSAEINYAF
jgi:hypothetical protein